MAGELSNYGADLALNMLFRNAGTRPAAVYLGLSTSSLSDTIVSTASASEVVDSGYSRQAITFGAPANVSSKETITNTGALTFGPFVTGGMTISYAFICDAVSGAGNIIAWMSLSVAKTPGVGDTLIFNINNLTFDLE